MSTYPGDQERDPSREDDEATRPVGWQQPEPPRGWDAPGPQQGSSWDAPPPSPYGQPSQQGYQQPSQQGYQPPPYAAPSYATQPPMGLPVAKPDHPQATLALVLGLVGLAGGLATCGLLFLTSPFAWVIGRRAVREIEASGGQLGGEGSARAGFVTGVIGSILLVLALVAVALYIAFVVWAISSSGSSSDYGNV